VTSSSSSIGKTGEKEAAKFLSEIAPTVRIKRPDYGISDMDLAMQDIKFAHLLWEIKTDKGLWSRRHAKALETIETIKAGEEYYVFDPRLFINIVLSRMDRRLKPPTWRAMPVRPLKTYKDMLEQPDKYAERQREKLPVLPVLLMQLRQGRGRPWARQVVMTCPYFRDMVDDEQSG
jgi:hypothetical protein